jgi:hypothetical protein
MPATGFCFESDESSPHPQPYFHKIHFNIIHSPTPAASSGMSGKIQQTFLLKIKNTKCFTMK